MVQSELDDILEKIASVRRLRRHIDKEQAILGPSRQCIPFRHYGARTALEGTEEEDYVQDKSERHQVYGFAIGKTIQALRPSLGDAAREDSMMVMLCTSPILW